MGATLGLTRLKLVWMPTRGVFDYILEAIANYTSEIDPEISNLFANSTSEYTGGMLYLDHWTDSQRFYTILEAVKKHRKDAVKNIITWQLTDAYFKQVDELIYLLEKKIDELNNSTNSYSSIVMHQKSDELNPQTNEKQND
jgi:uncharacterized hydantoinase/oxoprolinase family protein